MPREGQIPENARPGAQAQKSSILKKKLLEKHRCQEEGPDPGKLPPRGAGPEIVLKLMFHAANPFKERGSRAKLWEGPPCLMERTRW